MRGLTLVCLLGLAAVALSFPTYLDESQQQQQLEQQEQQDRQQQLQQEQERRQQQQQQEDEEQQRRQLAEQLRGQQQQQRQQPEIVMLPGARRTETIVYLRPRLIVPLHHSQSHRLNREGVVFFRPQYAEEQQELLA